MCWKPCLDCWPSFLHVHWQSLLSGALWYAFVLAWLQVQTGWHANRKSRIAQCACTASSMPAYQPVILTGFDQGTESSQKLSEHRSHGFSYPFVNACALPEAINNDLNVSVVHSLNQPSHHSFAKFLAWASTMRMNTAQSDGFARSQTKDL